MPGKRRPRRAPRARRATVYVLVLGVCAIAVAAGVGGLYVQRSRLRMARSATEIDRARLLATSGLEYALARIKADPNWRTTLGAGAWLSTHTLGTGNLSVAVSDPIDADILDDDTEQVRIVSVGLVGSARQSLAARLDMTKAAHTALACGAYGGAQVHFGLATINCDGPIASGANMSALLATVNADVEAAGSVTGLTYNRAQTTNATPRTAPGSTIADEWATRASTISAAAVNGQFRRVVIGPGTGAYGAPASGAGIYVIDAGGNSMTISECRVYGTLIILNCSDCRVTSSVRFDPATAGYPSLIVEGPLQLDLSSTALSESSINVNFNPAGAPWLGVTNSTKTNTYPSAMTGIVMATGNVEVKSPLTLTGSLIALGSLTFNAGATITTDATLTTTPAPGFYSITPALAASGVERVTY